LALSDTDVSLTPCAWCCSPPPCSPMRRPRRRRRPGLHLPSGPFSP